MKKFTLRILNVFKETIVDGEGLRYSIYFSGCGHRCLGCHNEFSWDCNNGELLTKEILDKICEEINSNPMLDGVTISGGDPLFNPQEMCEVLRILKEKTGKNIWLYTGFTLDQIWKDKNKHKCLNYVDVLVDGPFVKECYSPSLQFVGSSNQRIIEKINFNI